MKATEDAFNKSEHKLQYVKLARKYKTHPELHKALLANFISGHINKWVGYFSTQEAFDTYQKWSKGINILLEVFEQECVSIQKSLEVDKLNILDLFKVKDGQHPLIVRQYIGNGISLETLIILMDIFDLEKKWEDKIKDPIIYPDIIQLVKAYHPFMEYDKQSAKNIVKKMFILDKQA